MDGMYPEDLNKKSGTSQQTPAPHFASNRPPEDEDLYLPPSQRKKPKWRSALGKTLKIVIILVLVAAIAAGVYLKFFHNKTKPNTGKSTTHTAAPADAFTTKTKSYTSTNVGLTFSYPQTWTVNDTTDKLAVTSPVAQLTDVNGQTFQGKVILSVQPKGTTLKAFASGGVIAALDSQKISYTKPTDVQRAQTYLTFLQYTQTLVQNQLDSIIVTGDDGYRQNQYVPATDVAQLDPLITITFAKCTNQTCANPTASAIQSGMWSSNAAFQKTILGILQSIQVSD